MHECQKVLSAALFNYSLRILLLSPLTMRAL